ncbi:sugar O-acyltransferase (sialic acid O-acetyltransferase NeuD family) [Neisseria sp. HSC-16F19]|nr:NeuD/PglB/VioB family sugar acetyltransferase [Neisseria sp. HSC-16F19]MCP2039840.1 sugar O-acyltransferase (sialic acid O-acetyltransferase NeuD family) [Neisseria sp. HSC-16F19]
MLKRILDILISATALVLLSPVYAYIAYQVKKNLGTPVLFRQTRPGRYGKPFQMVKFRTMKDAWDENGHPLPDSERLTPFGQMLRASSLDELPELWNVLKGEMSLVGPRPLLMEYLPLYSEQQAKRHLVRPGITGHAQVNGRNAIGWAQKFELDTWYVENRSLWLDLQILLKTVHKVIARADIHSAGEATMSKFTGNEPDAVYAVYGAAGCGRSLMPVARACLAQTDPYARLYFIDDSLTGEAEINDHKALNYNDFLSLPHTQKHVLIAIANSRIRAAIAEKLQLDGIRLWSVIADEALLMDDVEIGAGAAISPFVTIGSNVKIGRAFHANLYSYAEHDCVIGDYVTFAPGVQCNGNVRIGDHAYIGAAAVIKQGTPDQPLLIGEGAVIGMGAVVTKNVAPGITVAGNPARPLTQTQTNKA